MKIKRQNRTIFLMLSVISIFFVYNQSFAGVVCNIEWASYCGAKGCRAPDINQYCIEEGGEGDCDGDSGCENGKVECMEGEYCVRKAWEVGYNLGNKRLGNRWVCVECADIPRDTPLVLKQGAIKLEKVEFGQAVIDPNLIEY